MNVMVELYSSVSYYAEAGGLISITTILSSAVMDDNKGNHQLEHHEAFIYRQK